MHFVKFSLILIKPVNRCFLCFQTSDWRCNLEKPSWVPVVCSKNIIWIKTCQLCLQASAWRCSLGNSSWALQYFVVEASCIYLTSSFGYFPGGVVLLLSEFNMKIIPPLLLFCFVLFCFVFVFACIFQGFFPGGTGGPPIRQKFCQSPPIRHLSPF